MQFKIDRNPLTTKQLQATLVADQPRGVASAADVFSVKGFVCLTQ